MADVKALLEQATPLPWHRHAYGHRSIREAAGKVTRSLFLVGESVPGGASRKLRDTFTDLTYIHDVEEGPSVALTGNGPKQTANADLIVHAVNHLPDYEAAVDALERVIRLVPYPSEQQHGPKWQLDNNRKVRDAVDTAREVLRRLRGEAVPS